MNTLYHRIIEQSRNQGIDPVDALRAMGLPATEAKDIVEAEAPATPEAPAPRQVTPVEPRSFNKEGIRLARSVFASLFGAR